MNKKYFPLFIITILFILAISLRAQDYLNFAYLKEHQIILDEFIKQHYLVSICLFVGAYILIVALSIPGATIMTIASGFFFGQIIGTMISVASASLGASILFISAKMASSNLAQRAGPWLKKMEKGFNENAFNYLLTLRLVPLFPFVAINLVAAILQIPLRIFFLATLIGIIPGSFIYAGIGVALKEVINEPNFTLNLMFKPKVLMALTGLGILSLLPILFKKYQKKHPLS